jgi:predicted NodU family carbamoyl transferase
MLEIARQEDLVLRAPDGQEFILSAIDDFEHEIALQRQNQKLMAFLDERFRQARQEKGIPLEDVKRQLRMNSDASKDSRREARSHPRRSARR